MSTQADVIAMPATQAGVIAVPVFDLADRLRKTLRETDISVQEMADYLEVSRNTVGAWINGKNRPNPSALKMWALRTGVPYSWIRDGENPHPAGPNGGSEGDVRSKGFEPPTF